MSVKVLFVVDGAPTAVTIPDGEVISEYNGVVDVEDSSGKTVGIFAVGGVIGVVVDKELAVSADEPTKAEFVKGTWQVRTPRKFDSFTDVPEGIVALERSDKVLNRERPMGIRRVDGVIEAAADPRISSSWISLSHRHREFAFPLTEQVGFEVDDDE